LAANLSGVQKQRVAAARALVVRPDAVFTDQFTVALDRQAAGTVVQNLKA